MTYETEKVLAGRKPISIAELDLDFCGNRWGTLPCTATAGNLFTYSEQFDHANWAKTRSTISANALTAPDGTTTADKLVETVDNGVHRVSQSRSRTSGLTYTVSVYAKKGERSFLYLNASAFTNANSYFNLDQGIVSLVLNGTASIVSVGNGRYRCSVTGTATATGSIAIFIQVTSESGTESYVGDVTKGIYIWGAQFHEGTKLLPYQRTVASAVAQTQTEPCYNTRKTCQDVPNYNNSGVKFSGDDSGSNQYINVTADAASGLRITGDVSIEACIKTDTSTNTLQRALRCGTGTNEYYTLRYDGTDNRIGFGWYDGAFKTIWSASNTAPANSILHLIAIRSGSDILLYVNAVDGTVSGAGAATTPIGTPSNLRIGATTASIQQFTGEIYFVRVYDRALTAAEVWTNYKNGNPYAAGGAVLDLSLHEGAGTTAADQSGNSNDGTLTNGPTWVKGKPKTYRLSDLTAENQFDIEALPYLIKSDPAQSRINPGKDFGHLGGVSLEFMDPPHHDRGIDPYVEFRSYTPESQGTYWGKLKARNPYYTGREMRIKSGFLPSTFNWDNFVTRTYIIDSITGPDKKGRVKMVGMDLLDSLDDKKIQVPVVTTGTLDATLNAGSTSSFTITGDATKYQTGTGYIAIDEEIIGYTSGSVAADVFTVGGTITRGLDGTTDVQHSSGTKAQRTEYFSDTARQLYESLLVTYGGVDSSYLPTSDWDTLAAVWFAVTYTRYIPQPTGLKTLLAELMIQTQSYIHWDEESATIKLGAIKPLDTGLTTYDETSHFKRDSINIKELKDSRVTDVIIHYAPNTPFSDEDPELWATFEHINASAEGQDQYNESIKKVIYARWLTTSGQAAQLGGRMVARYRDNDQEITFDFDAKDSSLLTGDQCYINTEKLPDEAGAAIDTPVHILQRDEIEVGHLYRYRAQRVHYTGRYARIMSASASSVYSSASDVEKADGGYIAASGGADFSDGGSAYKIV